LGDVCVIDPALLSEPREFRSRISELRKAVHDARPVQAGTSVRVPGDSSLQNRKRAKAAGRAITLDDRIYARICDIGAMSFLRSQEQS